MNLNSYIDKYGVYSFDEVPFNEVDNVVFANLSYLNLDSYVSKNRFNPKKLEIVANAFFKNYSKKDRNIYAVRKAIKLFRAIKNMRRYKDLLLYNYMYESGKNEQFSAFTIEINRNLVYVSFEGTDQTVSGWKEDFMFSYMFPTISQRKAIDYVNKHFIFRRKEIILGGHSKGGNLAIVAGMYANFFVKDKIIKIYNNDGPGLLKKQLESKEYQSIKDRLVNIIPNYSVVGILLYHENMCVVRSMKKSFLSHDSMMWVVRNKEFEKCELSSSSNELHNNLMKRIEEYDIEKREKFVSSLFSIFDKVGVVNITDIFEHKKLILKLIFEIKGIDDDIRKMIKDFVAIIFKTSSKVKIEEFKMMFQSREK